VNLSNCYDSGEGVAMNKAKVFELDNFAAELGHPIAINNLACCYLFGKGCSINHIQKLRLWERAAHMGYPMSQVNLGTHYYSEHVGFNL
jgi:TPR repeat protein